MTSSPFILIFGFVVVCVASFVLGFNLGRARTRRRKRKNGVHNLVWSTAFTGMGTVFVGYFGTLFQLGDWSRTMVIGLGMICLSIPLQFYLDWQVMK